MGRDSTYELVFTGPDHAVPGAEETVLVHRTDRTGPGGHPIYADDTGIVQAEISDQDDVRMIASGGHQEPATRVRVRSVPGA
ncbi:hypothetical protein GCM10010425_81200 [Streptomyces spororaveus]|uniref:DUF1918 domain-containing protein n=1 Tax=Streptomyces spororaveus TaxID=284039 RepID=A0ABQ3TQ23_9ACTN|nr:DUF6296 family protein [Streptomyces spororaveus]GHI82504.1 hypothetical protein Sspor_80650 [Streptomyces spororaveus]